MKKDNPVFIKSVTRHGTDMYPTYTVLLSSGQGMDSEKWEERWDPWNVDFTWDKENKVWDCNDNNYYKIDCNMKDSLVKKYVNDMLSNLDTKQEVKPEPKEPIREEKNDELNRKYPGRQQKIGGGPKLTRAESLNEMFPGLNLDPDAGSYPLGLGC